MARTSISQHAVCDGVHRCGQLQAAATAIMRELLQPKPRLVGKRAH